MLTNNVSFFLSTVWDSMVEGHSSNPAKRQRPTQAPIRQPIGHYEHNPLFDDRSPSSDSLNEASSSASLAYAMDMDNTYSNQNYPSAVENQYVSSEHNQNYLAHEASSVQFNFDTPQNKNKNNHINYLTGPMVIRVRPDGTPVDEDQRVALPRDDDREAMSIGKERLPTIAQITSEFKAANTAPVRRSPSSYPSHYYRASVRQY